MKIYIQYLVLPLFFLMQSCYTPTKNCKDFKTGTFTFSYTVDGVSKTEKFKRTEKFNIDYLQGKADTSSVRWINDCELVLTKLHPKNRAEKKAIHIKILSTDATSYLFEYAIVGSSKKQKGTAYITN